MVLAPSLLLSQKKNEISFIKTIRLDSVPYEQETLNYLVKDSSIYYVRKLDKELKIYKTNLIYSTDELFFTKTLNKRKHLHDFEIENDTVYLLFKDTLIIFKLTNFLDNKKIKTLALNNSYSKIRVYKSNIILTDCYNYAVDEISERGCPYLIIDKYNFSIKKYNKLNHDAIGLTHLPSYMYAIDYGKILLTNSLHNKFRLIEIDKNIESIIGDKTPINNGVDSIPFSTHIKPYTSAKGIVLKINKFARTINYYEGCSFVNDSTFLIIEKSKNKRILHFYTKKQNNWRLQNSIKFKNKKYSKKYKCLQFHFRNGFQIHDNKIYFTEIYVPSEIKNWKSLKKYLLTQSKPKFGIYEYEIKIY